jgi:uncharacterized membrane protein
MMVKSFLVSLVTLGVIDAVWLGSMMPFYKKHMGSLLEPSFSMVPAVFFYVIYAFAVAFLAVVPNAGSPGKAALYGAVLGLTAYGTYNLTNAAILKGWAMPTTIVDLVWGTVLTVTVAYVTAVVVGKIG